MGNEFVTVKGRRYAVEGNGELDLGINKNHSAKEHYDHYETPFEDIAEIEGLETLTHLKELILGPNYITEIKGLENLSNLQVLSLHDNEIKEIKGLENLTSLQKLVLSSNRIKEIKGLETLTDLRYLTLNSNNIEVIQGLEHLSNLQKLDLRYNPVGASEKILQWTKGAQEVVKYCQEKKKRTHLVTFREDIYGVYDTLDLSNKEIKNVSEIEGLEHVTHFRILNLRNNYLKKIKGLEFLSDLKKLDLSKNLIQEITGLETLTNLEYLDLSLNQIKEIKGLETLTNLKELLLNHNPIRDEEKHLVEMSAQEIVKYCQEKARVTKKKATEGK